MPTGRPSWAAIAEVDTFHKARCIADDAQKTIAAAIGGAYRISAREMLLIPVVVAEVDDSDKGFNVANDAAKPIPVHVGEKTTAGRILMTIGIRAIGELITVIIHTIITGCAYSFACRRISAVLGAVAPVFGRRIAEIIGAPVHGARWVAGTGRVITTVIGIVAIDLSVTVIVNQVFACVHDNLIQGWISAVFRASTLIFASSGITDSVTAGLTCWVTRAIRIGTAGQTIAVMVKITATYLGGAGVTSGAVVVAVVVVRYVAARLIAGLRAVARIAVAVTVGITVPGRANVPLVYLTIAVVIFPIAHLGTAGVAR